jgi:tRNA-dihydrouridine synthase
MSSFWHSFDKKFMVLAPMEDVTDTVFREIIMSLSDADVLNVVFTEFTSVDGLCDLRGRTKVMERLVSNQSEQQLLKARNTKLVAQIWGSEPDKFYEAACIISELGYFDGIDINMGCPVKKVIKEKCCSALINYPDLAKEIVFATQQGTSLPVSVKTRIGFRDIITEKWIGQLLETNPAAITIHGRTQQMMSTGNAMWDEIAKAVTLKNKTGSSTVMIGNGDVTDYNDAMYKASTCGVNGVMVGTGIFKNPWLFNKKPHEVTVEERLDTLRKHIKLYRNTWDKRKNYNILKRFFKIYLNGFRGAAESREMIMMAHGYEEALDILKTVRNMLILTSEQVSS